MFSQDLECYVCFEKYDLFLHTPKVLPQCRHTVCKRCLNNILKDNDPKCPFDKTKFKTAQRELPRSSDNFALKELLEGRSKYGTFNVDDNPIHSSVQPKFIEIERITKQIK